ncbi:hypothetical protein Neosp_009420 [[Neocosmospora] mangrovei]
MTHHAESGKQTEDSLDKVIVDSTPQTRGMEVRMENDRAQPEDGNLVEDPVRRLARRFQSRESPSIPPPPPLFYRRPYAGSDVATEDEASGGSYLSTSHSDDGGSSDDEEGSISSSTAAPTDTTSRNRLRRFIPNWAHGIFSRGRHDHRESGKLEAFLLELPARSDLLSKPSLVKLDMEQKDIEAAFSAIMPHRCRRGRLQMWEQYKALDLRVRHEVHLAMTLAKQWDTQSRTWIAIEVMQSSDVDQQESVHIVLFFRVGEEVDPVTLNTTSGNFTLPYEHCRSWEVYEEKRMAPRREELSILPLRRQRTSSYRRAMVDTEPMEGVRILAQRSRPSDSEPTLPYRVDINAPSSAATDSESTTNIDNGELDEEIEGLLGPEEVMIDEIDTSKLDLGELLKRWTNVPDSGGNSVPSPESDKLGASEMRID